MPSEKRWDLYHFILGLILLLVLFFVIFQHFKVSFTDYIKFLLALLLLVYIPGQALFWLARLKGSRLEMGTLSLVMGMTSSVLVYRISGIIHFLPLFIIWWIFLFGYFVHRLIKNPPRRKDFEFSLTSAGIVFMMIVLLVMGMLFFDNFRNGIVQHDGSLPINMHYYDGFIRNAVVRELSHSIPPQMPFAAGIPLSYHHGMDLFAALLYKHFSLGVLDLLHRLTMTFFFALLLLTLFIFTRKFTGSNKASLLGIFLVLFGSGGLGYIGGILSKYPGYWGKIFYSFYFLDLLSINSFLPSLSVLLAGFFCLLNYFKSHKLSWLVVSCFLLALITDYKMTFTAPILGALAISGLVYFIRYREKAAVKALILTGLLLGPLLLLAYFINQNGPQYAPGIRFNDWIVFSLVDLKLLFLGKSWGELTRNSHVTLINTLLFFPILVGFFLGSFGLSFFALPGTIKEFISSRKNTLMRFFLVSFIIVGVFYFFVFNPSLGGRSRNWTNIYVYYLSVIILILFWAEKVISFCEKRGKLLKVVIVSLVIILSIPNAIQFFWAKTRYPQKRTFERLHIEACQWLNKNTQKDSVVIHSQKINYVCYFADRRVVLDTSPHSYLTFHLTTKQIQERNKDIERFFFDPVVNADVLQKYRVSYVWEVKNKEFAIAEKDKNRRIDCYTSLGGKKIKKFYKTHSLSSVYTNDHYSIHKVNVYSYKESDVYVLKEQGNTRKFIRFSDIYGKDRPKN